MFPACEKEKKKSPRFLGREHKHVQHPESTGRRDESMWGNRRQRRGQSTTQDMSSGVYTLGILPATKTKVELNFYSEAGTVLQKVPSVCCLPPLPSFIQLLALFQGLSLPLPRAGLDGLQHLWVTRVPVGSLRQREVSPASSLQLRSGPSTPPPRGSTPLMQMTLPFPESLWPSVPLPTQHPQRMPSHLGSAQPHSPGSPGSLDLSYKAWLLAPSLGTARSDSCPWEDESDAGRPFMQEIPISQQAWSTPHCFRN